MSLRLTLCCLLLTATLAAQQGEKAKCTLAGTVIKDQGGEPLKKAMVEIIAEDQEQGSNYTAITDSEGKFKLDSVRPGRYRVFVERSGFIEVDKHRHRSAEVAISLQAGQELSDLVLRMLPSAVITGRVADEDGDPMPNVEIAVLHYAYNTGHRRLETERSERTNDLGEYRIGGLLPGSYFVSASPPPDFWSFSQARDNDQPDSAAQPDTGYATTYYPGTTNRSQAASVELHPGDDMPVDFNLVPVQAFRIHGTVANVAKGTSKKGVVMLRLQDASQVISSAAEVDKDGNFEIRHAVPGSYALLFASGEGESTVTAHQDVEVGNADVDGLRITPLAASQIHGQVRIDGNSRVDLSELFVSLTPAEGEDFRSSIGSDRGQVKRDGSFELKNVPAGTYTVHVEGQSQNYFLKKITVGGHDASDSSFRVGGGTLAMDLVISTNVGVVFGAVVDDKNQPVANAVVVAVPAAEHRKQLERYQKTVTDQAGRFALRGLIPDDYTVLAWQDVEDGAYYDPEFLKQYQDAGQAVHLAEGGRESVVLKAVPASEE